MVKVKVKGPKGVFTFSYPFFPFFASFPKIVGPGLKRNLEEKSLVKWR